MIIAVVAVGTIVVLSNNSPSKSGDEQSGSLTASNTVNHTSTSENTSTDEDNKNTGVTVADFREMDRAAIQSWAEANNIDCKITEAYSDSAAKGSFISQSMNPGEIIGQGDTVEIVFSLGNKPSAEYENALKKAEMYAKTMHMSKQGVYDQLTSEYGEKFPATAAQYAIDNMQADWNANALEKARIYQKTLHMSKNAIYAQLSSAFGEKFTEAEAQYAIDHLDD